MTSSSQHDSWCRSLEDLPPATVRTTRPMERIATTDPFDSLPSVFARTPDPEDPYINAFAHLEGHTWGSVIGLGRCEPEAMALVARMLWRVAECRGHGTPVVIEIHPLDLQTGRNHHNQRDQSPPFDGRRHVPRRYRDRGRGRCPRSPRPSRVRFSLPPLQEEQARGGRAVSRLGNTSSDNSLFSQALSASSPSTATPTSSVPARTQGRPRRPQPQPPTPGQTSFPGGHTSPRSSNPVGIRATSGRSPVPSRASASVLTSCLKSRGTTTASSEPSQASIPQQQQQGQRRGRQGRRFTAGEWGDEVADSMEETDDDDVVVTRVKRRRIG